MAKRLGVQFDLASRAISETSRHLRAARSGCHQLLRRRRHPPQRLQHQQWRLLHVERSPEVHVSLGSQERLERPILLLSLRRAPRRAVQQHHGQTFHRPRLRQSRGQPAGGRGVVLLQCALVRSQVGVVPQRGQHRARANGSPIAQQVRLCRRKSAALQRSQRAHEAVRRCV